MHVYTLDEQDRQLERKKEGQIILMDRMAHVIVIEANGGGEDAAATAAAAGKCFICENAAKMLCELCSVRSCCLFHHEMHRGDPDACFPFTVQQKPGVGR